MPRCCWDCAKAKIEESAQAKLAKAFQARLKPTVVAFHNHAGFRMSHPVTGGVMIPASEDMLKKVWTGCMELTCFEPKEAK